MRLSVTIPLLALATGLAAPALRGEEKKPAPVSFTKQVQPFLKERCITCHTGDSAAQNLSFDTPETILKGGDQGPVIVKGKGAESLLIHYLTGAREPRMPPGQPAEMSQIEMVRLWIDQGAKFDVPPKKEAGKKEPGKGPKK